eukprot:1000428-Amphidinium_carterae.1
MDPAPGHTDPYRDSGGACFCTFHAGTVDCTQIAQWTRKILDSQILRRDAFAQCKGCSCPFSWATRMFEHGEEIEESVVSLFGEVGRCLWWSGGLEQIAPPPWNPVLATA